MLQVQRFIRLVPQLLACIAAFGLVGCTTMNGAKEGGSGTNNMAAPLTDGQILHIAMTSDMGEVITSEPAINKAMSAEVRQFAQDMVTTHTQAANMTRQVANQRGIALQRNQISMARENEARGVAQQLNAISDAEFDRMYMEAQYTLHLQTLNNLDFNLIPAANDPQVRAHLQEKRALVQDHLNRARQIIITMLM